MGAPTVFHADHDRGHPRNKGLKCTPREALPQHDCASVIHTDHVNNLLGSVNPE
jgi:hypothetical protein